MIFYYFHATHWDREWYQSFQEFRSYLTDEMEHLLNIMDSQDDFIYVFDGQTSVLYDACELRPSLRPRLEAAIAGGRLKVGPWYVMPDELLVSAESLIRNLQTGHRIAGEFGAKEAWKVGYCCDIFGHIANLPQIFSGFGLKGAVIWRGVDKAKGGYTFWKSPDGTVLKAICLSHRGYVGGSLNVRPFWDEPVKKEQYCQSIRTVMEEFGNHWGNSGILSDSMDHEFASSHTSDWLKWIKEMYPDAEVKRSDYLDVFADEFNDPALPFIEGEQITQPKDPLGFAVQIPGTLSSRYDLKLANDTCRDLLELHVEPMFARAAAEKRKVPHEKLRYLWRYYLQNHAHDSICGCSVDAVHRQMLTRFEDVQSLGGAFLEDERKEELLRLTGRTWGQISAAAANFTENYTDVYKNDEGRYLLRIYNPLPYEIYDTAEYKLLFPANFPRKQFEPMGYEHTDSFRLYDSNGEEIACTIRKIECNQIVRTYRIDRMIRDIYTVNCRIKLAPSAWTTVEIRPDEKPVRSFGGLAVGSRSATNGILKVDIAPDGTYTLTDLRSGRILPGQNELRIDRECGDGWCNCTPVGSAADVSTSNASVRILCDSKVRTEFEITRRYGIPEELVFAGTIGEQYAGIRESDHTVTYTVRTRLALNAGSDRLDVRMEIDNNIKDCRVKLLIPTMIGGDFCVSQAGTLLTRKENREHGTLSEEWFEKEPVGRNFDGLAFKRSADGSGVALFAKAGMHELGALSGEGSPLLLTLYRAFRRTFTKNGEPDGQLQKKLTFEFAIKCFSKESSSNALYRELQMFRTGRLCDFLSASAIINSTAAIPFLKLEGDLVVSAVKPADDETPGTVVVRCWNLNDQPVSAGLTAFAALADAVCANLDETPAGKADFSGNTVSFTVNPSQMKTLKLHF